MTHLKKKPILRYLPLFAHPSLELNLSLHLNMALGGRGVERGGEKNPYENVEKYLSSDNI